MPSIKPLLRVGLACAISLAAADAAFAQQFAGQTVNVIVNFSAGGPTDVEARVVARHLPKYLSGVAGVVVRNVGGGGGNIGVNQLGEPSARDRLNLGFFTWNPLNQIIGEPTLRVRYNDLKFIAGMRQTSLIYIRRDTAPGVGKSADVAKARLFRLGVMGPSNITTLRVRLALDLLGAKYEIIQGYKGLRDIDTAMLQGDIQASTNSLPGYFTFAKPNMVEKGIVIPLLQFDRADVSLGRSPNLPDVPTFYEVYKEVWGKDSVPSGEKWQALRLLTQLVDTMYRTAFMPPNAPPAAVEEMRAAFESLGKDAEFIAQYEKVVLTRPHFIVGGEGERVVAELVNIQPALVSFLRKYIEAAQ
ncbi:MAG: hypothetical protein HYU75_18740 [Betaproteobacteria bacterium]|nr:hypothetical protein [Betaproteobacteria bacterium]